MSRLVQRPRVWPSSLESGINDLGVLLQSCGGDPTCFSTGLPATLAAYQANLITIFSRIRNEASYTGPIVAVTIYAANYNDPAEVGSITLLHAVLASVAHAFQADVADALSAFGLASLPSGGSACDARLANTAPLKVTTRSRFREVAKGIADNTCYQAPFLKRPYG